MELVNIHDFIENTVAECDSTFLSRERKLPESFKEYVKSSPDSSKFTFLDYTTIVSTGLNIYCPNQWFYIAAYYCKLYPVLKQYKDAVYSNADLPESMKDHKAFFSKLAGNYDYAKTIFSKGKLSSEDLELLTKFVSDYNWWRGGKGIERNDFYYSPILSSAALVNQSQSYVAEICKFLVENPTALSILTETIEDELKSKNTAFHQDKQQLSNLQQIFYGAPGTGKSFEINRLTEDKAVVRTTFHPDSDYSTFVGAYKPVAEEAEARVVPVVVATGITLEQNQGTYREKRITYKFVKQAFLKAYLGAWKKYADAGEGEAKHQYLVIEEINRGNCAQIFGDIFQLLDRQDNGFSSYPIEADTDLQQEIRRAFAEEEECLIEDLKADEAVEKYTSNYGKTLSEDILYGRVLLLPPNLYIWATMNTSDQSLFPIDSAFKRRWDWKYMPIDTTKKAWSIDIDGNSYSWSSFLEKINKEIFEATSSEDKQLGFYFCKAQDGVIPAEKFVGKVLFYIYNDVFKDYGFDRDFFKDKDNSSKPIAFRDYFQNDGSINQKLVAKLLDNLGVEKKIKGEAES